MADPLPILRTQNVFFTIQNLIWSGKSNGQEIATPGGKHMNKYNCDPLHDLVPFAQVKKREKHPWRSVTFSKVVG